MNDVEFVPSNICSDTINENDSRKVSLGANIDIENLPEQGAPPCFYKHNPLPCQPFCSLKKITHKVLITIKNTTIEQLTYEFFKEALYPFFMPFVRCLIPFLGALCSGTPSLATILMTVIYPHAILAISCIS